MKLALLGYGKMGKTIERMAESQGHSIVYKKTTDSEVGRFEEAEAAIEFSAPSAAVENISRCFEAGIPVISGTTGWLSEWDSIINLCEKRNGSFIYASNFSIGVNLFFNLNSYLAKMMAQWKEYGVTMEEIHHTEKKDAPSGTAITLAEDIIEAKGLSGWKLDSNDSSKLSIHAVREGDVKGTHSIRYKSPIDTIRISHEAHNRDGFAMGAILAAQWLLDKKGVYTMKDVLNLT